jgi:hypothetical protein
MLELLLREEILLHRNHVSMSPDDELRLAEMGALCNVGAGGLSSAPACADGKERLLIMRTS